MKIDSNKIIVNVLLFFMTIVMLLAFTFVTWDFTLALNGMLFKGIAIGLLMIIALYIIKKMKFIKYENRKKDLAVYIGVGIFILIFSLFANSTWHYLRYRDVFPGYFWYFLKDSITYQYGVRYIILALIYAALVFVDMKFIKAKKFSYICGEIIGLNDYEKLCDAEDIDEEEENGK